MSVIHRLQLLRKKLADKDHWTQYSRAKDSDGWPVNPLADNARQWCLLGALTNVCRADYVGEEAVKDYLYKVLPRDRPDASLVRWNDSPGRRHEEVLQLIDKAIEAAREDAVKGANGLYRVLHARHTS